MLKTSGFRIMNRLAYKVGETRFLEKGGEDYLVIFDTMTDFLSNNYKNAIHHERPLSLYKHDKTEIKCDAEPMELDHVSSTEFIHYHMISLDFATNCNADIIRNIFVHLFKIKLDNPLQDSSWINPNTGFEYQWNKYFLIVEYLSVFVYKLLSFICFYLFLFTNTYRFVKK